MSHLLGKSGIIRAYLPAAFVFLLAVALALSWFGAQALVFALPFVCLGLIPLSQDRRRTGDAATDLRRALDRELDKPLNSGHDFACILLRITPAQITPLTLTRLRQSIRPDDRIFDLSEGQIALLLAPVPGLGESALPTLGLRFQAIVKEQVFTEDSPLHPTASLALCLAPAGRTRSGTALLDGLTVTLEEAARRGPSTLLVHDPGPSSRR
ncbi:hypothetical protein RA2_03000 [Roseovarius sp. A-2]|uniref:hypothetical protein n=1 Tax=Roseovarius sp. A-2 TaxID=1570360 RepID=UPI0009B522CF|nr:hypothetical protein [Roseovarius sp. A-2]GAW35932.1 hypothetical protein RA2_03000 [Roseovarius sp. A-2]